MKFFSELCSHLVLQNKYSMLAEGAKWGNFGKYKKSKKNIEYKKIFLHVCYLTYGYAEFISGVIFPI